MKTESGLQGNKKEERKGETKEGEDHDPTASDHKRTPRFFCSFDQVKIRLEDERK